MAQESERIGLAQNRADRAKAQSLAYNQAGDNAEMAGDSDQDWKPKAMAEDCPGDN